MIFWSGYGFGSHARMRSKDATGCVRLHKEVLRRPTQTAAVEAGAEVKQKGSHGLARCSISGSVNTIQGWVDLRSRQREYVIFRRRVVARWTSFQAIRPRMSQEANQRLDGNRHDHAARGSTRPL